MIVVYWTDVNLTSPAMKTFKETEMSESLVFCNQKRNEGFVHVNMSYSTTDMVGKPGVSSVEDGKLPNGNNYGWKKRRQ